MLLLALAPMPWAFYRLMRVIVSIACGGFAFAEFAKREAVTGWVVALAALLILFNPLVPLRFPREAWAFLDLGASVVLLCYYAACGKFSLSFLENTRSNPLAFLRP